MSHEQAHGVLPGAEGNVKGGRWPRGLPAFHHRGSTMSERICHRCGGAILEAPGVAFELPMGGRESHSQRVVLCVECAEALQAFLLEPSTRFLDGLGGPLADTAVASMDLTGSFV